MILEIELDEIVLDLGDTEVQFEFINPLYDKDGVPRGYSLPFTFSMTPRNQAAIQHAQRLDTASTDDVFPAKVRLDGLPFFSGQITLKKRNGGRVQAYVENTVSAFTKSSTKLAALSFPDQELPADLCKSMILLYVASFDQSMAVALNGKTYLHLEAGGGSLSPALDIAAQINVDFPGLATTAVDGLVHYIILECLPGTEPFFIDISPIEDLSVVDDFFTITDFLFDPPHDFTGPPDFISLQRADNWETVLSTWHNQAITDVTHVFPVLKNDFFYSDDATDNPVYKNYVNYFPYAFNVNQYQPQQFEYNITPMPRVRSVLDQVFADFNFGSITGEFMDELDIEQLIVANTVSLDEIGLDGTVGFLRYWNPYVRVWNLADHLPNMSAIAFWQAFRNTFNAAAYFVDNTVEIIPKRRVLLTEVEDWTDKAEVAYSFEPNKFEGYTLDWTRDNDDEMVDEYPNDLLKFVSDAGKVPLDTAFSPVYDTSELDEIQGIDRFWLIPEMKMKGNSPHFELTNGFGPRITFYRGLQPDSLGATYPFATNGKLNFDGVVVGNYTLDWNGPDGLNAQWWEEWLNFDLAAKDIDKSMRLEAHDLVELVKFRKPRKRINHQQGQMVGIAASVKFSASASILSPTIIEFKGEG